DENVAGLHLPALHKALTREGIEATTIAVPAGEASKSFERLQDVVGQLLAARLERNDVVIAFGGGVVGDLAGFAAAIARRGMQLMQVPTSLLAQVDSSVGGKTGINAPQGKNLVGAFYQPRLVLADTDLLATLPAREFAAGYAEIVKYGLIDAPEFFAWLEANREAVFAGGEATIHAIAECCTAKAAIVTADEHEAGRRALLNLGHTFAHALEGACGYDAARLVHGEAVAIGLVLAHRFSAELGLAPADDTRLVEAHLSQAGLPVVISAISGPPLAVAQLMHHISQDKKVTSGRLTFILTKGIGRAFIADNVDADKVRQFLQHQLET
ncbi:MAG: 3-dehydroquinate synthase, partial [Hyphomicrobiales bacterium]|nr:3-dehydroquinate synthase [Hyphomicrobiales bacterium]